ncbi:MAG: ATPase [Beijerinckiaceae bacterium]|nr:ATPase [Beijerinckiaceae bacterium]
MSIRFTEGWFGDGEDPARLDPVRTARAALKPQRPKRFYTAVSIEPSPEGFRLLLDGRPARTKLKRLLALETEAAASLLAAEWAAQGEEINAATMPVTRIAHAGIDHVADAREAVIADILAYAGTDLVCYRAGEPERLVALQAQHWDPVLAHAQARYGARFLLSEGITHVAQNPAAIEALRPGIVRHEAAAALAALHVLTSVSGSALIALAVADGALGPDAGYDAGEVDADFELDLWGADEEAAERRAFRLADFRAAAALLEALTG